MPQRHLPSPSPLIYTADAALRLITIPNLSGFGEIEIMKYSACVLSHALGIQNSCTSFEYLGSAVLKSVKKISRVDMGVSRIDYGCSHIVHLRGLHATSSTSRIVVCSLLYGLVEGGW